MSGVDWQVGDLALCVSRRAYRAPNIYNSSLSLLAVGAIYKVAGFTFCGGLVFEEVKSSHPEGGFKAFRFRKIRPHTPDAEDAETIALLNRRPAKVNAALSRHMAETGQTELTAMRSLASRKQAQELDRTKRAGMLRHLERWSHV